MERIKQGISKIRQQELALRKELAQRTIGYILTALGLVAGLAWNQAIQGLINMLFPGAGKGILVQFVYAIVITIIIVVISFYLLRLTEKKEEQKLEEKK